MQSSHKSIPRWWGSHRCHWLYSLPSVSGVQETPRAAGDQCRAALLCPQDWHKAVRLAEPSLLVTPQPGSPSWTAPDLQAISPVLRLGFKALRARFPSHLHVNAVAVMTGHRTWRQTQGAAACSKCWAADLERGWSLNCSSTGRPLKLRFPCVLCVGWRNSPACRSTEHLPQEATVVRTSMRTVVMRTTWIDVSQSLWWWRVLELKLLKFT